MDNRLQGLSAFEEDDAPTDVAQSTNAAAVNLSKSASNLPPAPNQSRVSKIKSAIATKDDDFERAHDSKFLAPHSPSPQ